jgi:hypothetical protein
MRTPEVIKADPVGNRATSMLERLESVSMHALFFQCSDDPFDHSVLLRAMRLDELLLQSHLCGLGFSGA